MSAVQAVDLMPFAQPVVDRDGITFLLPDRVYRGFRGDRAAFMRALLRRTDLEEVFHAGLVRCWEVNIRVQGYDLVVECERVPAITYPMEWPTAMVREAALVIARVGLALARRGLTLQDAHPWNVLFDGPRAVFVDLGSIVPARAVGGMWMAEFRRHLIVPLVLHRMRLHGWADAVLRLHRTSGAKAFWDATLLRPWFPPGFARLATRRKVPEAFFQALLGYVEGLPDSAGRSVWSHYEQDHGARISDRSTYHAKQVVVDEFLDMLPPGMLLDLGANAGWYSELASGHGNKVIAVDTDDWTLSALYRKARAHALPILPVRLDIMWPTGSYGMALGYQDAYTRLRCDTVLALALLHHLAGFHHVSFETFAHVINRLAQSAAIIEFIPRDDPHVANWPLAREPWYEIDHLIQAMRPFFPAVDARPSSPAPRQMLLFRRRNDAAR